MVEWSRALDVRLSEWCCSVSMVWVQIPSREEQKFDNTVWFNFQTYIYIYIYIWIIAIYQLLIAPIVKTPIPDDSLCQLKTLKCLVAMDRGFIQKSCSEKSGNLMSASVKFLVQLKESLSIFSILKGCQN